MKRAPYHTSLRDIPARPSHSQARADFAPVPPTAAEFLGWPNTQHPWLRLAFIHDALARNQSLPETKRWRVTAIDLAAALGLNQKTICLDVKFLQEELGAPIAFDERHSYRYTEPVSPVFVDYLEVLRARKAAKHGQTSAALPAAEPEPESVKIKGCAARSRSKYTAFERMTRIHELLAGGRAMTGTQLARELRSSVGRMNADIAFMRLRLGLPVVFRPEIGAYVYAGPADSSAISEKPGP